MAALDAERAFEQKEKKRLEKEREKEAAKMQKEKDKQEQRAAKKLQKKEDKKKRKEEEAAAAAAAAEAEGEEGEGGEGDRQRARRGKGINELGPDDPMLLWKKVPGCDCAVVHEAEDFVKMAADGLPVVLRLKRSLAKKIMEFHSCVTGTNRQEILAVAGSMKTEADTFISWFAEKAEAAAD